jgi:hypothetical protein
MIAFPEVFIYNILEGKKVREQGEEHYETTSFHLFHPLWIYSTGEWTEFRFW